MPLHEHLARNMSFQFSPNNFFPQITLIDCNQLLPSGTLTVADPENP